jgi:hypothetical protein
VTRCLRRLRPSLTVSAVARRRCPGRSDRGPKALVKGVCPLWSQAVTGNAWATPRPAGTGHRLSLEGGFVVDDGRDRHLQERAGALGFEDLCGYLQARCDAGDSIPRIATELGVRDWQVTGALVRSGVRLAPRRERLARQRRRHAEERIAARVFELGFADMQAYLLDRVVQQGWLLADVAAELAAHRLTVCRLLDRHGIRRVRRTAMERAGCSRWGGRRAGRRG